MLKLWKGIFMAITPLEIHNKEFPTKMRGYDQDEVNEFLDQIIRDYELLIRDNKELKDNLEIVNKKLVNFEDMQDSLNRSILVAQDAADRLQVNTDKEIEVLKLEANNYVENQKQEADSYASDVRKEADSYASDTRKEADSYVSDVRKEAEQYADSVHKEADNNADRLLQEAVLKARKIEDETEALRKQSRVFRQRLQLLIESQLELLTKEEWDNLLVGQPIEFPNTETIVEVEKELEEKIETQELENAADDYDQAEDDYYEESEEVIAFEQADNGEEVAFSDEEHYNNDDSNEEISDEPDVEYEEGTMPAIELPEAE